MDPRVWMYDLATYSDGFLYNARWVFLGALAGGTVLGVLALMKTPAGWSAPDDRLDFWRPVVVALGFVSLPTSVVTVPRGWELFGATFVFGLLCGLFSWPVIAGFRNLVLSLLAIIQVVLILRGIVYQGVGMTTYFVLLLALAAGVFVLSGAGFIGQPLKERSDIGLALLGSVEFMAFAISPFGIDFLVPSLSEDEKTILGITAVLLGVALAFRPAFTIALGFSSTIILGVLYQVFLALERENYPGSPLDPDWSWFYAFGGVLIGYALLRAPFVQMRLSSSMRL